MIKKLHVVAGPEHPHQAQKPVDWTWGAARVGRTARSARRRA